MNKKSDLYILKRDGRKELLDINKIHKMTEAACEGLSGVSSSQVEMNSGLQFRDGMTTDEIQEILIKSANDLIDLENPNYQYVAARLLLLAYRNTYMENLCQRKVMCLCDTLLPQISNVECMINQSYQNFLMMNGTN